MILRAPAPDEMDWVVKREAAVYAQEYGWDSTFQKLVAQIVDDSVLNADPACERCWIAEVDGLNVGHIFLVRHPEQFGVAKLRLLFVEPAARGMGVGKALVEECVRFAKAAGYHTIVLWTQSMLTPAIRIINRPVSA